jgi:hypothetical protein
LSMKVKFDIDNHVYMIFFQEEDLAGLEGQWQENQYYYRFADACIIGTINGATGNVCIRRT